MRTKNVPEPHIPHGSKQHTNVTRVRIVTLALLHTFTTHRVHVAFTVNVHVRLGELSGVVKGCGVGGRERERLGRYTHRSLPPPWLSPAQAPMQNHPLSRSRWEITFCPSITGWIFGTTRPDHFERDTALARDISPREGVPSLASLLATAFVTVTR